MSGATGAKTIRVLLADDSALFRNGLRSMFELEDDMLVVGEAADGAEAQELVRNLQPDVILLDINMPRVDGIAAARELRRGYPHLGIIMLTMFGEEEIVTEARAVGADDYLRKDTSFSEIVTKVRAAASEHQSVGSPAAAPDVAIEGEREASDRALFGWIAAGWDDTEIAAAAGLTEAAVQERLEDLYRRHSLANRTQAALYAIRHGFA